MQQAIEAEAGQDLSPEEKVRVQQAVAGFVTKLQQEADDRVNKRASIEKRWLKNIRQINGEYEPDVLQTLKDAERSTVFINETRPKVNACKARLSDMLFPTDDKNYGISPTPVPKLAEEAQEAVAQAKDLVEQANDAIKAQQPNHAALAQEAQAAADTGMRLKSEMDEARKRSKSMEDEIDDQLTESNYAAAARDAIDDAVEIGTGIMKGPVANAERIRRSWKQEEAEDGQDAVYQLNYEEQPRPAFYRTDPWGFFPSPDATGIEESEDFFERYLKTQKQLRAMAKQPGFDKDAIRRVLQAEPDKNAPSYIGELRAIMGDDSALKGQKYHVWEYRGAIEADDMRDICACLGKNDLIDAQDETDPLEEIQVVIWFCQNEVLKFGVHHLDSGEPIYSVFNLEEDKASIWGYGIPDLMRDSQSVMGAAWRMMMDNSGLSSGPQIEIDPSVLEPVDGKWALVARKLWKRRQDAPAGKPGIIVHNIASHQNELANIIELAKQFIDDETSISLLAQGEQGAHSTQTSSGIALLMNAVNIVFRRMVKNFDDDMTTPNIRRIYDWNMQFSNKEHIKGDYSVDARGSSVLLVREVQSQNLMLLANMTAHPSFGMMLKGAAILRKLSQSMLIEADEIIFTDDEIKEQIEANDNTPEQTPEELKIQFQAAEAQKQRDHEVSIKAMERDMTMMQFAEKNNLELAKVQAMLGDKQADRDSKERMLAAEAAIKQEFGHGL